MLKDDLRTEIAELRVQIGAIQGRRRRTKTASVLGILALIALTATATRYVLAAANSPTPQIVPYRGVLKQNGVAVPNGTKHMVFSLYDRAAGGTLVWGPDTRSVTVADGVFNVTLGDALKLTDAQLQSATLWLDIQVEGQMLTPRQQLLATPYARRADFAVNGVPVGTIVASGASTIPDGWLPCDGSLLDQSAYPDLASSIGTTWANGAAVPAGKFMLPDLRGMFLRGVDARSAGGTDPDAPRNLGSTQHSAFAKHSHTVSDPGHSHTLGNQTWCFSLSLTTGSGACSFGVNGGIANNPPTATAMTGTTSVNETGSANETRPENASVQFIIKY
jgi:microcystin-dependent protein